MMGQGNITPYGGMAGSFSVPQVAATTMGPGSRLYGHNPFGAPPTMNTMGGRGPYMGGPVGPGIPGGRAAPQFGGDARQAYDIARRQGMLGSRMGAGASGQAQTDYNNGMLGGVSDKIGRGMNPVTQQQVGDYQHNFQVGMNTPDSGGVVPGIDPGDVLKQYTQDQRNKFGAAMGNGGNAALAGFMMG